MAVDEVSPATGGGRLEGTCSPPTTTRIRDDAMEAPVTPRATQPRSRSITPPPVDLRATCLQATGSGDEKPLRLAELPPLTLQGISRMPGVISVCDDGNALEGPAKLPEPTVVHSGQMQMHGLPGCLFGQTHGLPGCFCASSEVSTPAALTVPSSTAALSPDFTYVHTSESLAALPEPSPEVALVPPPPVDFSFSHSFLASLSMPGDKSVSNDDSVRPRRCRISTRKVLPTRSGPWPRQARRCQTSSRLPVPSSTSAMSPDVPDARVCAARTCPEGHAMIRFVDGCNDDYFCPQCDDCSDQF